MSNYKYIGTELDRFAAATNWKEYVRRQVAPYLGRDVLEVGGGNGGTTRVFCAPGRFDRWVCLEPDPLLASELGQRIDAEELPECCSLVVGTLDDARPLAPFDSLLYMDVLEHIEYDAAELEHAAELLRPGGHVVVLSPAHQWLFTPFDQSIGHYRRYSRASLRAIGPDSLELVRLSYLDTVGLLASLGNRFLLRQAQPNSRQISLWDKGMVPVSRVVDPLLGYAVGKSVLGVWRKPLTATK